MIVEGEIDDAIKVLDVIRREACDDMRYGFDNNWNKFMKKMRVLSTQSSGGRIQNYIFEELGWTKVSSKLDKGDVKNSLGQYFEVKVTTITTSNPNVNILQIRLWQNISGYHIFVINALNDYELIHFQLSKSEMIDEVKLCASNSHGTKEANETNKNIEWSIHFKWGKNKICDRWIEKYKQNTNLDS